MRMASIAPPESGAVEQFRSRQPADEASDVGFSESSDPRTDRVNRALFDQLSRAFMRRAEERYVRRLTPEQLRRSLADLLSFILVRPPG